MKSCILILRNFITLSTIFIPLRAFDLTAAKDHTAWYIFIHGIESGPSHRVRYVTVREMLLWNVGLKNFAHRNFSLSEIQ